MAIEKIENRKAHKLKHILDNFSGASTNEIWVHYKPGSIVSGSTDQHIASEHIVWIAGVADSTNDQLVALTSGGLPVKTGLLDTGSANEYKRRMTSTGAAGVCTLTLTVPTDGYVEVDRLYTLHTLTAAETLLMDIMDSDDNLSRNIFAAEAIANGEWLNLPFPIDRAALAKSNYPGWDSSEGPLKLYEGQYITLTTSALTATDTLDFMISYRSNGVTFTEALSGNGSMGAIP